MRKAAAILTLIIALSAVAMAAPTAVIQPNQPDDIILDSDNGYEVTKTYDGTDSTGNITNYNWDILETDQSDDGPEGEFTFDRSTNETEVTVRLTVTNGSATPDSTDVLEVTQNIRDLPEVSISAGSTDVETGDTVTFTSTVQNTMHDPITSYSWTLADGTEIGTGTSLSYSFDSGGTYDITLNATDSFGDEGRSNTVTVTASEPSDGSSGSGGGGSINLGQSEDRPDQDTGLGPIQAGGRAIVTIDRSDQTGVNSISINVNNAVNDLNVTVHPRRRQRPASIDRDVDGRSYGYMKIDSNINDTTTANATIQFNVRRNWVRTNDINVSSIRLSRYTEGNWNRLPTVPVNVTGDRLTFNATSPGFSYFAVSGDENRSGPACGNDICEEGETWQTCQADCDNPEEVDAAQKAIEQAEEVIPARAPGYTSLEEARQAYDEGNYLKAQARAEQALYEYRNAGGLPIIPFIVAIILVAVAGLAYWKRETIMEALDERHDMSRYGDSSEETSTPEGEVDERAIERRLGDLSTTVRDDLESGKHENQKKDLYSILNQAAEAVDDGRYRDADRLLDDLEGRLENRSPKE
jgi:PGF-pre-PGF domain-containing protein